VDQAGARHIADGRDENGSDRVEKARHGADGGDRHQEERPTGGAGECQ